MVTLALLAAALLVQDIAADRITYDQLIECAATFRLAGAVADMDGEPALKDAAVVSALAYDNLAYLYARPLGIAETDTDAAILAALDAQITKYERPLTSSMPQLARSAMSTDQQVCVVISQRIAQE